jgi:hypothetical protein
MRKTRGQTLEPRKSHFRLTEGNCSKTWRKWRETSPSFWQVLAATKSRFMKRGNWPDCPGRYLCYLCTFQKDKALIFHMIMFVIVFASALHWSLSRARWIQSVSSHSISLIFILILSLYLRVYLPSGIYPSGFSNKILFAFLTTPSVLYAPPISSSWLYHPNNILWRVQIRELLIMHSTFYIVVFR